MAATISTVHGAAPLVLKMSILIPNGRHISTPVAVHIVSTGTMVMPLAREDADTSVERSIRTIGVILICDISIHK